MWKVLSMKYGFFCNVSFRQFKKIENDLCLERFYKSFNILLSVFFMLLYWKLHPGTIWSAGSALAQFLSFKSGFWFQKAAENGALRTLATDFPAWFILGPYLVGHAYLYVCALGLAKIRRQVRIYLVRNDIFTHNIFNIIHKTPLFTFKISSGNQLSWLLTLYRQTK